MPPNWGDFSQENIRMSEQEREASLRLRGMIDQTLSQTSADMRDQADRVEEALCRRLSESEEACRSLENELKAVSSHSRAGFIWNAEISVSVAIHCYERLF